MRYSGFSRLALILLLGLSGCQAIPPRGTDAEAPPVIVARTIPAPTIQASVVNPNLSADVTESSAAKLNIITHGSPVPDGTIAPSEGSPVELRAALSHTGYSQSAPNPLLLKLDFAVTARPAADRPPLNIALVLDRSGSMAEQNKFPFTMEAARGVIENLTDRDTISLIAFNERVVVLSPAGRAVNKPFLSHRLEEISPEGYTDISAGLLEGISQVNSKATDGQVKQVFLLTDGLANKGVTSSAGLRKIVGNAQAKGVRLSTFGVGTEFNEKLLTDMAAAGGGRYKYARSAEQIPTAFREELRGLLEVVAQNVRLDVKINQGGALGKIYGELSEQPTASHTFNIGNLRIGERGGVMLALRPDNFRADGAIDVTATITFDDPQTGERVQRMVNERALSTPAWTKESARENDSVVLYGAALDAVESARQGAEGFDVERYNRSRTAFDQLYQRAREYALATRNQDLLNQTFLLKHFMEELEIERAQGALHSHAEARGRFQKESDYEQYLLFHHREEQR
jgi:Ca-activated chloride channel family protein